MDFKHKRKDRRLTLEEFKHEFPNIDLTAKIPDRYRIRTEDNFKPFRVFPNGKTIAFVFDLKNDNLQTLWVIDHVGLPVPRGW